MGIRAAVLSGLLLAAGCGGGDGAGGAGGRPQVVAAFYPLFEAAQRVGGDRADVVNLTPAGTEPHDLELTPRQVDRIEDADVVVFVGNGFQPAVEEVAERGKGRAVDALEGLALREGSAGEGDDPHVWLDPGLLARLVGRLEAVLVEADPAGGSVYAANATEYRRELGVLDGELAARLARCQRRVIVTSHAAFGYLARRYGLTQEAIAGLSPESEPDPKRLNDLVSLVRSTGTTTVFTETLVSPKVAQTLAREAGVTTAVLSSLEGLTEAERKAGESYASIMRRNADILAGALGCGPAG